MIKGGCFLTCKLSEFINPLSAVVIPASHIKELGFVEIHFADLCNGFCSSVLHGAPR